jgi:hypothetical protein
MKLTINSRVAGREFVFWMGHRGGGIFLENGSMIGYTGRSCCHGGSFSGRQMEASPENFERECRRWYRCYIAYLKREWAGRESDDEAQG